MARARSIPLKDFRLECETLEAAVLALQLSTKEELAPHRPGSAENPDPGWRGWMRWHGVLHRRHARHELAASGVKPPLEGAELEAFLTRCITGEPKTVVLDLQDATGEPLVVHVYPKSRRALLVLHARDRQAAYLAKGFRTLQQLGTPKDLALLERTGLALDAQWAHLLWAVTHPGPWLPFDPLTEAPRPPDWAVHCMAEDTLKIFLAHRLVTQDALAILSQLLGSLTPVDTDREQLAGWGAFVVNAAEDEGVPLIVIDQDRALTQVLAKVYVRATAAEAAEARRRDRRAG